MITAEDNVGKMERCLADLKRSHHPEDCGDVDSVHGPSVSTSDSVQAPTDVQEEECEAGGMPSFWEAEDMRFWRMYTEEELEGQFEILAQIMDHSDRLIDSLHQLPDGVLVDAIVRMIVKVAMSCTDPLGHAALEIAQARAVDYRERRRESGHPV